MTLSVIHYCILCNRSHVYFLYKIAFTVVDLGATRTFLSPSLFFLFLLKINLYIQFSLFEFFSLECSSSESLELSEYSSSESILQELSE